MVLKEILEQKEIEVEEKKRHLSYEKLLVKDMSGFSVRSLAAALAKDSFGLIAEIKKASPSAGDIHPDAIPTELAQIYEEAGASAISVLTDESYFKGTLDDLTAVRQQVKVPVLRKDFIIDEYQVVESRVAGADTILLIVRIVPVERLRHLHELARQTGLEVLVEVHDEADLEKALDVGADIIGINNRDLDTLTVDLSTTERLIKHVPEGKKIISESGINTKEEVKRLKDLGVDAVLVGETLMRSPDIVAKMRELIGA